MIKLTDKACKELEAYFADKEKGTIRIYLAAGGCGGPSLNLALDDAGSEDHVQEVSNFTFCINKELLTKVQGVTIDLTYMGFTLEPVIPLPMPENGGCSSCSSCGHH